MSGQGRVFAIREWTLKPDREPDAENSTYSMECAECDESSMPSEDYREAQDWALRHAGRNPTHRAFREIILRPWRAYMHG
ncbi:hypothetical protein SEA_HAIZUM_50 [Streptomyces phage Haizum]|nr:hypothetical protein SEA_HAIZUM_50 [Streptomyces phage Haizum]